MIYDLFSFLKQKISREKKTFIKRKIQRFRAAFHPKDLSAKARIFKTDKFGKHSYMSHYQNHISHLRKKRINLLEIGVGGYDNPISGGNSLRMWKSYFKKGQIFSIDIFEKQKLQESRITIFTGSQADHNFLKKVVGEIGEIDVIIDDGSHINEHVIASFNYLFPHLRTNGLYVIEDVQTSYWPEYGGSSINLNDTTTIIGYFKSFIDGVNHAEVISPNYEPSYYDLNISSLHFYHNLIFIQKGKNNKGSSYLVNNQLPDNTHEE